MNHGMSMHVNVRHDMGIPLITSHTVVVDMPVFGCLRLLLFELNPHHSYCKYRLYQIIMVYNDI